MEPSDPRSVLDTSILINININIGKYKDLYRGGEGKVEGSCGNGRGGGGVK